jgi:hypothetical protein
MLINEVLDLKEKAFISLVGAGGKSTIFPTSALFSLLKDKIPIE